MKKMNAIAIPQITGVMTASEDTLLRRSLRRWTAGLFVSAILGAVSGLGGLAIGAMSLVGLVSPGTELSTLGTVFVAASFPLFGFAAHCLDKASAADKAIGLEYYKQQGLKDDNY